MFPQFFMLTLGAPFTPLFTSMLTSLSYFYISLAMAEVMETLSLIWSISLSYESKKTIFLPIGWLMFFIYLIRFISFSSQALDSSSIGSIIYYNFFFTKSSFTKSQRSEFNSFSSSLSSQLILGTFLIFFQSNQLILKEYSQSLSKLSKISLSISQRFKLDRPELMLSNFISYFLVSSIMFFLLGCFFAIFPYFIYLSNSQSRLLYLSNRESYSYLSLFLFEPCLSFSQNYNLILQFYSLSSRSLLSLLLPPEPDSIISLRFWLSFLSQSIQFMTLLLSLAESCRVSSYQIYCINLLFYQTHQDLSLKIMFSQFLDINIYLSLYQTILVISSSYRLSLSLISYLFLLLMSLISVIFDFCSYCLFFRVMFYKRIVQFYFFKSQTSTFSCSFSCFNSQSKMLVLQWACFSFQLFYWVFNQSSQTLSYLQQSSTILLFMFSFDSLNNLSQVEIFREAIYSQFTTNYIQLLNLSFYFMSDFNFSIILPLEVISSFMFSFYYCSYFNFLQIYQF